MIALSVFSDDNRFASRIAITSNEMALMGTPCTVVIR